MYQPPQQDPSQWGSPTGTTNYPQQSPYQGSPSQPGIPYPQPGYPPNPLQSPYQGSPSQPGIPYPQPGYPPNPLQYQQYPLQQPMQPPKKKANKLVIGCVGAIVLVVIIIIAAAVGHGSSSNTGTLSTNNTPSAASPTQASTTNNQHFKVGDKVKVGDTWQAVVNQVSTDSGGIFSSALKSGDTYLVVDISLTNLTSKEQNVSSVLNFTLQDASGQKFNESIDPNAGATLDGKVSAGSPLRGVIAYEVPASTKSFVLNFAPDLISSGQTTWDLNL